MEVDRGHAEVAVPELALDDVQRHAFTQELEGVRVTELGGREASPDTRMSCAAVSPPLGTSAGTGTLARVSLGT